jgi:cytochrome bd-type quinol oxidase subunit 1
MLDGADALLLARIQFAFTVSFHFLFPAFTIGLASYLAVLEALWLKTGKPLYLDLFRYWVKVFAVTSPWASCRGSCCPTSSAPTGAASRSWSATWSDR